MTIKKFPFSFKKFPFSFFKFPLLMIALCLTLLPTLSAPSFAAGIDPNKEDMLRELGFTLSSPDLMNEPGNPYGGGTKNISPVMEIMIATRAQNSANSTFKTFDRKNSYYVDYRLYGLLSTNFETRSDVISGPEQYRLYAGDFRGDGRKQIVAQLSMTTNGQIWLRFINAANGTVYSDADMRVSRSTDGFQNGGDFIDSRFWEPKVFLSAAVGDFNGDGRDELAVFVSNTSTVGNRIYFFGFNGPDDRTIRPRGWDMSCIDLPSDVFPRSGINGKRDYVTARLAAGDLNGDGLDDLVIVANYHNYSLAIGNNAANAASRLLIYHSTSRSGNFAFQLQPEKPVLRVRNTSGTYTSTHHLRDANVAIGDINGDGINEIVVGGLISDGWTYRMTMKQFGDLYTAVPISAVGYFNGYGVVGAGSLTGGVYTDAFTYIGQGYEGDQIVRGFTSAVNPPVALTTYKQDGVGQPESVFMDGAILKIGEGNRFEYSSQKSSPWLYATAFEQDRVFIWVDDVVAGNFLNDPIGREELVYVYARDYSLYFSTNYDYVGGPNSGIARNDNSSFRSVRSVVAVDYDDDGMMVRYTGFKDYYFTNPHVISVLQAAPSFRRLHDEAGWYENAGSTSINFTQGTGQTESGTSTITAGVIFGVEFKTSFFGLAESGFEFETKLSMSFSRNWEESISKTYGVSISSPGDEDRVTLTMIPYTRYHYELWSPIRTFLTEAEHNKNVADHANYIKLLETESQYDSKYIEYVREAYRLAKLIESTLELRKTYNWGAALPGGWEPYEVSVPSSPAFTTLTVDQYDAVARSFGTETIREKIFPANYRQGEPSTYRSSSAGLRDVETGKNPVGGTAGDWLTVYPSGLVTHSMNIELSSSKTKGMSRGMSMETEFVVKLGGVKAGVSLEVGGEQGFAWMTSEGRAFTGTVSNLPLGSKSEGFEFQWQFLKHEAKLDDQNIYVLEYMTRNVKSPTEFRAVIAPESHTFPEMPSNHPNPPAHEFTLTNRGGGGFTNLAASLEKAEASAFVISTPLSATQLPVNGTATLSVRPKIALTTGVHTDNLIITGDNGLSIRVPLTVTVGAPQFTTVYVTTTGFGARNGNGWTNAFAGLQAALDEAAKPGSIIEEIRVAQGTYMPTSVAGDGATLSDMAFILPSGVRLLGGYNAGNDTRNINLNKTILSGAVGSGVVAYHVVIAAGDMQGAVLDGFTIMDGNANGSGSITVNGVPIVRNAGGGIHVSRCGSFTISNCTVIGNRAQSGGGIYADGEFVNPCDLLVLQSVIASNTGGSGYHSNYATARFVNCTFNGSNSGYDVTGFWTFRTNTTLINCILAGTIREVGTLTFRNTIINGKYYDSAGTAWDVATDNLFVNAVTDLRLTASSPALNRGANTVSGVTMPTVDLDGNPRIVGGIIDLGAYELQTVTLTPLSVNLTAGAGRVTLAPQIAEVGFAYYYVSSASTAAAPAYGANISTISGAAAYTANVNISGTNNVAIFVRVYKVETTGSTIVGFGQASATPTATPTYNTTITVPTVNGVSPYDGTLANPTAAAEGATVTLPAILSQNIGTGFAFKQWEVTAGGVTLQNPTNLSGVTFTMGSAHVAVRATFEAEPFTFNNETLPSGVFGAAYRANVTPATGGSGNFTYSATVPAGLNMSPSGVITGTPNAAVSAATFTVTATDITGATATATYTLTIAKATQTLSAGNITRMPNDGDINLANHASSTAGVQSGAIIYTVINAGTTGASITGTTLSYATVGSATIAAETAGSENYEGAFITFTLTVSSTPVFAISLNPATDKDFGTVTVGYSTQAAHSVTITNTGNQPTGQLIIALTGANRTDFTLSGTSITNIIVGGTDSVTVAPNTGLPVGTYEATVNIANSNNGISESFRVSFEVSAAADRIITGHTALTPINLNTNENILTLADMIASGKLPTQVTVTDGTTPVTANITGWTGTFNGAATGAKTLTAVWDAPANYTKGATPIVITITVNVNVAQIEPFVPVTGITGVPLTTRAGTSLTLAGTVTPANATNKNIVWSLADIGNTRATVTGNIFRSDTAGTATVSATITDGLAIGNAYMQNFTIAVTVDPNNNIGIKGEQIGLDNDVSGDGWGWNAKDKKLTLTGGDVGEIKITMNGDVTVDILNDAFADSIVKDGNGDLIITGVSGKALTLISKPGPAIHSKSGSVIITGSVDVVIESSGGSAIKAKVSIEISTDGTVTVTMTGDGFALEAELPGGVINILNGTTNLTVRKTDHAFNVKPNISGGNTKVNVNVSEKPTNGNGGSGGCNATSSLIILFAVISFIAARGMNN